MKLINSVQQRDLFQPAVILFLLIFLGLSIPTGWLLIDWSHLTGIFYFMGFEIMFLGLAYDLTEGLFALFSKPLFVPKVIRTAGRPPVALLMTVCDDVRTDRWGQLLQDYLNYDVFILDDSSDPLQQELVDRAGYMTLRRNNRHAYKAGSLNHWFDQYGGRYQYFVVLDSDSLIPPDFISRMVQYAEHPQNANIAIFQSRILPVEAKTFFAKTLGQVACLRLFAQERFANRAGLILSWGHNHLVRTEAIQQIHGFHESISPDDTTLSLMLGARGYSICLVDVESYDSDPEDIFAFGRRISRWAGQTTEVFKLPWEQAPFRLKLLLCQHLYSYLIHNVYAILLLMTAWGFDSREITLRKAVDFVQWNGSYFWPWGMVLVSLVLIWSLQIGIRLLVAVKAQVSIKAFLTHTLLATAITGFVGLSVDLTILRVIAGGKLKFDPTNARNITTPASSLKQLILMGGWLVLGGVILTGMILRNRLLFFSLNSLWLIFWLGTPYTLWLFHRDQPLLPRMPQ
jgi:glycosyltransferase involved in cell wall biosynthesis